MFVTSMESHMIPITTIAIVSPNPSLYMQRLKQRKMMPSQIKSPTEAMVARESFIAKALALEILICFPITRYLALKVS